MVKALFLDAEGTFLLFNPSLGEIYQRLWKEFGVEVLPEEASKRMRQIFKRIFKEELQPPLNGRVCKEAWQKVFYQAFSEYQGLKVFEEVFHRAYQFFASPECVSVAPFFRDFVHEVKARGLKLAVISNWDCRLYSILEGHGLLPFFDGVFLGCEVGYLKPHQEIFLKALSHFKIQPAQALMMGDTLEDDILVPQSLGMKTFFIKGSPDYQRLWSELQAIL